MPGQQYQNLTIVLVLVLFLDGSDAAGGAAAEAAGGPLAIVLLGQLAQRVHVVRAQLRQDPWQQVVQLCETHAILGTGEYAGHIRRCERKVGRKDCLAREV